MEGLIAGYLGGKLTDLIEAEFVRSVIRPRREKRARNFFDSFCREVASAHPLDLRQRLDELFADQIRSEVLFDSYHAVCMGRSKEIGPRVIALLTAQIVLRDGVATDEEESMFAAAEEFSDNEFLMFREYLRKSLTAAEGPEGGDSSINDHGEVVCRIRVTDVDSRWSLGSVPMSGQNLGSWLGSWAARLSTNGLLDDIVEQESFPYKEDSERHIDEDGVVTRFTWSAVFSPAAVIFLALIERVCSGSAPESAGDGR